MNKLRIVLGCVIGAVLICIVGLVWAININLNEEWDDLQVVEVSTDRMIYQSLNEIEESSTIIVEAKVVDTIGQEVSTYYDVDLDKNVPGSGYTKRKLEIQKVIKGDVSIGDSIILMQDYYVWTDTDDEKKLITLTELKPLKNGENYLLFLSWSKKFESYYETGDFQGVYPMNKEAYLDKEFSYVYPNETHSWNLVPIYEEVCQKYSIC